MRGIKLSSGLMIILPACLKSQVIKKFQTQNMDQNADGNIVWNRLNGIRYVFKLYFKGITTQNKETLKTIFEEGIDKALDYYPDINNPDSYKVLVNGPFDFQELFIKGSGKWAGIMELIGEKPIDERGDVATYYSDDFLIDTATNAEFQEKYPKWGYYGMWPAETTENGMLICPRGAGDKIYEDFANYGQDRAYFIFYDIEATDIQSDSEYILTDVYFDINTYVNILYHPITMKIETQIIENGTTINDVEINLPNEINYDAKIYKEGDTFTTYYRELGVNDWTKITSGSFTNHHDLSQIRIGNMRVGFKLDKFEVIPDKIRCDI